MVERPTLRERRNAWRALKREPDESATPIRIGVAASFTAEPVEPYLGWALSERGMAADITFADFGQIPQVCLDPDAHLPGSDAIVVLWRLEDLVPNALDRALGERGGDAAAELIEEARLLGTLTAQLAKNAGVPIILGTPPTPVGFGIDPQDSVETVLLRSWRQKAEDAFLEGAMGGSAQPMIVDMAAVQSVAGVGASFDQRKWLMYRQPFAEDLYGDLGDRLTEVVVALHRPSPKVLALDCDNTLWGGIVGEDGLGGIAIGQTFPGSAFRDFQLTAKRLKEQGVLLAIVSKNEHADVLEVFEKHDEMVLRPDDIAAWRVNWEPKPDNLASIAEELNLGLDSFVFVDDSDHEVASVRSRLPMVHTLQVPEEPAELPSLVPSSGLFRMRSISAEDRARTDMMLAEQARNTERAEMSQEEFLESLGLWVEVFDAGEEHLARVTQLINKTNQFNLTTKRRTEAEVSALLDDDDYRVAALRVGDRFGDYGITGVSIVERQGEHAEIDTFLMSCRVLGRGVETAFLSNVVAGEQERVLGRYLPTQKNAQVADFYERHGFDDAGEDGSFEIAAESAPEIPNHLDVR